MSETEDPLPKLKERPNRHPFRWRLIPAVFLFFVGTLAILSSLVILMVTIYVNLRFGLIVPNPDTPTLNQVALTPANVTRFQLYCWIGVIGTISAFAWLRGRWRLAWITLGLTWALMGARTLFN